LRVLEQYPEVVNAAFHSLEPCSIVAYLAIVTDQLAERLEEGGKSEDEDEKSVTLSPELAALYEATAIVLENGIKLLWLLFHVSLKQASDIVCDDSTNGVQCSWSGKDRG